MFNWLVKKATKAVHEAQDEIEQEKKRKEAIEWGRKAAQSFGADLDAYAGRRFEEIQTKYMKVFRDRLDLAAVDDEAPPLILARIEHKIFLDNVQKLKPQLVEEILTACADWMKVWAQMGNEGEMKQVIEKKVDDFALTMMLEAGLTELLSRVDHLKPLDEAWRAANPEKSAQYPPPK
jgi:hypothetical protein